MNTEPENNQEKIEEDQPVEKKDSILESIKFVVDMMNSGKANAKDVYPKGRYHGD